MVTGSPCSVGPKPSTKPMIPGAFFIKKGPATPDGDTGKLGTISALGHPFQGSVRANLHQRQYSLDDVGITDPGWTFDVGSLTIPGWRPCRIAMLIRKDYASGGKNCQEPAGFGLKN